MINPSDRVNAFKEFEYEGWQKSVEKYHSSFGNLTKQTIGTLLDAVDAGAGKKLLDIASGPGYVAAAAFQRGCSVTGVDFAEAMVAKAKELHPQIEFQQGDAESLAFPDSQFAAAVMNFGILHLAQPEKALSEAFRVISSGGKYAFAVWEKAEHCAAFQIMLSAIETYGDTQVALPEGPPFFRFSDRDRCIDALQTVGFKNVSVQTVPMLWELADGNELFDAFYQGSARTGGLLRVQDTKSLENIRAAVNQTTLNYITNHKLLLPMAALVASGEKP
ncbi:class I SAM-dependent methyltransferase [Aerosakkonema funiforme]|uniref:class I SAM-dependent methyltransferase n=1 Tax=Aerosakkonema funiforme TaxID=1246630 RepID=UPI0035B7B4C6